MHILGCRHRLTPVSSVKGSVHPRSVFSVAARRAAGAVGEPPRPATARRATEPAPPGQACPAWGGVRARGFRRGDPGDRLWRSAVSAVVRVASCVRARGAGGARRRAAQSSLLFIEINSNCIRIVRTLQLRSERYNFDPIRQDRSRCDRRRRVAERASDHGCRAGGAPRGGVPVPPVTRNARRPDPTGTLPVCPRVP